MEDSSWELDHQEKPLPTVTRNQRAEIQAQQKHEREEGQQGQAQLRAKHPRAGSHRLEGEHLNPKRHMNVTLVLVSVSIFLIKTRLRK